MTYKGEQRSNPSKPKTKGSYVGPHVKNHVVQKIPHHTGKWGNTLNPLLCARALLKPTSTSHPTISWISSFPYKRLFSAFGITSVQGLCRRSTPKTCRTRGRSVKVTSSERKRRTKRTRPYSSSVDAGVASPLSTTGAGRFCTFTGSNWSCLSRGTECKRWAHREGPN